MAEDKLIAGLKQVCGEGNVIDGARAGEEYLKDFLGVFEGRARAVVLPGSEEEVSRAARLCFESRAPIVPFGGNTSYAGAATADDSGKAVVMAMRRMRKVKADAQNRTLTAEAGCVLEDARRAAEGAGLLFPLLLGAKGSCQLGGNLATNAGGLNVLRYGNCRELCLSLRAVLPDGSVTGNLHGLRKDNTGYDLKQLFIGSEGTLGIITGAVFKLFTPPPAHGCAFAEVNSAAAAMRLFGFCREKLGESLEAFELIPQLLFELLAEHQPQVRLPFAKFPRYAVLFEFAAESESDAKTKLDAVLMEALEKELIADAVPAQTESARAQFWNARESTPEATKRAGKWIKMDVSLPLSRLAAFVDKMETSLPQISPGRYIIAFGHLGDGNLHLSAMPDDKTKSAQIAAEVYETVREYNGSFSAEHGVGQSKTHLLQQYKDPAALATMRAVKNALDPRNIMNPGKILPAN